MRYILLFLILPMFCFAQTALQELSFKVMEVRGEVFRSNTTNQWIPVKEGDLLSEKTEIITGLHAGLSLDLNEDSYITISQLSDVILNSTQIQKYAFHTEIYLINGMIIFSTEKQEEIDNELSVMFINGMVHLKNASGQIYMRKEYGATILSESGEITVERTVLKKKIKHKLNAGESCCIKIDGKITENDYFIRKELLLPGQENTSLPLENLPQFFSKYKSRNSYFRRK